MLRRENDLSNPQNRSIEPAARMSVLVPHSRPADHTRGYAASPATSAAEGASLGEGHTANNLIAPPERSPYRLAVGKPHAA